ncbi:type II toxin-antitoxin system YafO family toxin [Thalassotalea litorea]|uniref:type II toxin-antitoxin system YafO family toxin n=1 Tax=Thalassotalea litorea TaxID=2020715 RepID=UPI003735EE4F
MIRVFKSALIRQQLTDDELDNLVKDFKRYKLTGVLPDLFGRDVAYDHPNTLPIITAEQVQHIHLASADSPFPIKLLQFKRTSDQHLLYCPSAIHDDTYLLMAILSPNAHKQAFDRNVMYKLGVMAEKFRHNY